MYLLVFLQFILLLLNQLSNYITDFSIQKDEKCSTYSVVYIII